MKISKKLGMTLLGHAIVGGMGYMSVRYPRLWEPFVALGGFAAVNTWVYTHTQGKVDMAKEAATIGILNGTPSVTIPSVNPPNIILNPPSAVPPSPPEL